MFVKSVSEHSHLRTFTDVFQKANEIHITMLLDFLYETQAR